MLRIGQEINGYLGGIFGRDSDCERRVESIGFDRVVLRNEYGHMNFYEGDPEELLEIYLESLKNN